MNLAARVEAEGRTAWRWTCTDEAATWAFRVALVLTIPVMYIVGRHQWFIRDDWAFVLTREQIRTQVGWDEWLFLPTVGHWMTVPLLAYRAIGATFGIDSYWPYLALNMAVHVAIVLCVRKLCQRAAVRPWTTSLTCSALLVFGAGWENIVFAIQITYGFSLLAFLVHVLLVDHDGPVDRRDVVGSAAALVGAMSSGFGPIFMGGIAVLLCLRRRWAALAVAVVPQGIAMLWWWWAWGSTSPEESTGGDAAQIPAYAIRGVVATFDSLTGAIGLGGVAAAASLGVALWRGPGWRTQSLLLTLWITAVAMYLGLGTQRVGFGVENAAISRYQYMGAMLLVPSLALAVDQLRRIGREAVWVGRVILVTALVVGLGSLRTDSAQWALRAAEERRTLELIAGSGLAEQADPSHQPLPFSPDVRVSSIPTLVAAGAITPRTPATPEDVALVREALGLAG